MKRNRGDPELEVVTIRCGEGTVRPMLTSGMRQRVPDDSVRARVLPTRSLAYWDRPGITYGSWNPHDWLCPLLPTAC